MKTYTTKQDDKWDLIALEQYGSKSYVDRLMMANTEHVNTYIFPAGVVLNLPEISASNLSISLPPWKRVL